MVLYYDAFYSKNMRETIIISDAVWEEIKRALHFQIEGLSL